MGRLFARASLLLLVAVWVAAPRDARLADVPGKVRRAIFEAQAFTEAGDHAGAADALRNCLRDDPDRDHVLLRFYLGNALVLDGRPAEALEEYEAATGLDPHFDQAWINLGQVAYNLGHFGLAGAALVRGHAESAMPRTTHLFYAAMAYHLDEQYDRAAELLGDLISGRHGEPELEWYRLLLSTSLNLEPRDAPAAQIASMLDRYGHDPEAWRLIFQYAAGQGDFRRAAVALTLADYLQPLARSELMQAGDMCLAIDIPAQACRFYERALVDSAAAGELERLASAYLASHDPAKAQEALTRALAHEPTARLWSLQGDLHYMRGEFERSYRAYRACSELDSVRGRAHLMLARCALELDRLSAARDHLQAAGRYPEQAAPAAELMRRLGACEGDDF